MVLTVDIGNTNIVLGGFSGDELYFVSRVYTNKEKTEDEYAALFDSIIKLKGYKPEMISGAIISSVVPPVFQAIKNAITQLCGCKVLSVSPGTKTGLNIKIDDPAILGADMVSSAVGALGRYTMPCIIVDLGTATKFSVLDESGNFLGGPIMPGVNISLDALSKRTAQLPHIEFDKVDHVIGTNSIDSMRAGILYGTASMVDGMIERIVKEIGKKATVVMTGGISKAIAPYCKAEIVYDENIILYGLNNIYKKNVKPKA